MNDLFGSTRSVVTSRYALLTPAGFVTSVLPGWRNADCIVAISPRIGNAQFCQLLITLHAEGQGQGYSGEHEYVVFVRAGSVVAQVGGAEKLLFAGGYCYIPPHSTYHIQAASESPQLLIFQRTYVPLEGFDPPAALFGDAEQVEGLPFMGDEDARLKTLLPDTPGFDLAVNLFTFQPGATLPMVETHIMEHGLLMLQGQGIYRLGADWHPVQAGDVIWMAPYCPQWFVATGKTAARYIYYKDVNRAPF